MRNIALRIEYDGTDFAGSQWQSNGRTVQSELEQAWEQLNQERKRIILAGRTDAGVHARGQVANVHTETSRDLNTIVRGLNAILPGDVAVSHSWEVPAEFHARHTAIRREYRYVIDNGRVATPHLRRHATHIAYTLDYAAMNEALEALIGTHDFVMFSDGPQEGPTVRDCYVAHCGPTTLWGQPILVIEIAANAFLRHMVRKIVGLVLLIGTGRLGIEQMGETLAATHKRPGPLAPAHGLYLMRVGYPGDEQAIA